MNFITEELGISVIWISLGLALIKGMSMVLSIVSAY